MIAVTPEGVAALKSMASALDDGAQEISSACDALTGAIEGLNNTGPHRSSIIDLADTIQQQISGASKPANELADKLEQKADEYQEFIDTDRFTSSGK